MDIPLLSFIFSLNISIPVSVPSGSHGLMWLPTPSTHVLTANNVYSLYSDPTTSFLHILLLFSPPLHLRELTGFLWLVSNIDLQLPLLAHASTTDPSALLVLCHLQLLYQTMLHPRNCFTDKSPTLHIYCVCLLLLPHTLMPHKHSLSQLPISSFSCSNAFWSAITLHSNTAPLSE